MASQEGRVGLSQEEANVISRRNQWDSPLLRLPAEIRNMIFAHTLGGLIVKFTKGPRKPSDWRTDAVDRKCDTVWARLIAHDEALSRDDDMPVSKLTGVLKTCRQIYTETSTLLLKLNTLELSPTELGHFLDNLTTGQRDAISSFRTAELDPMDPMKDKFAARFERYYSRLTTASGLDVWSGLQNLARMRGLKEVMIGKGCVDEIYPVQSVESVIAQVKVYAGGRDIEVIFDDMPAS